MKPTYEDLQSQLTALASQLESVVAENAGLKQQTPDVRSASMFEAIEKAEKLMGDGMPELAMVEAFEILKMKRTPATDAFLAEVRASGVEMFGQYHNFSEKLFIQKEAQKFAAQLRQGGAA